MKIYTLKVIPYDLDDSNQVREAEKMNTYLSTKEPIKVITTVDIDNLASRIYERNELPLTQEILDLFYDNVKDELDVYLSDKASEFIDHIYEVIKEPCEDCEKVICECFK